MRYSERIVDSSRPGKYFLLIVLLSLLSAISAFSQGTDPSREEKKLRANAIKALQSEKFGEAISIYTDLLRLAPDNSDYNYEMGLAIYEQGIHRGKAAPYLERAIETASGDTLPDMYLFAGKSEQYAGNFYLAIDFFNQYKRLMAKTGTEGEDVDRYIQMCENGMVQFENSLDYVRIENMGEAINSPFADYSPVVTNDERIILFTSRRDNTTGAQIDVDDKYFEDIYFSLNVNGTYTLASNYDSTERVMSKGVNTDMHDATITYSNNETELFIYRDQDVWVSKLEDGLWTIPTKAGGRINSDKGFEPSVFITQDQKTMFVVSDIKGGLGSRDIYITTKDDYGQWKALENLGTTVNTKADEDAPFLTPDGNTLYFASKGHNSMGDYDIFKSVKQADGSWGQAENLGPPINTPGHDRYFVTTDNGAVGYYASDRDGGFGETDIYRIVLDCKNVTNTIVRGVVISEETHSPLAATITIFDPKTNVIHRTYKSDRKYGRYEMRLKTETTYGFKIEAEGYLPHHGEFTVPKQCEYFILFQEIRIENLKDSVGRVIAQRAIINNAFFDVDKKIKEDYIAEGDSVANKTPEQMDSLRAVVAKESQPIELTNYVRLIDVIDPQGVRLASFALGEKPVLAIQPRDEYEATYSDRIMEADRQYYSEMYAEARANYMIASGIKPEELYPRQQVEMIQEKTKDKPFEVYMATIPEHDNSRLIVPQLIDSSQFITPEDMPIVANEPQTKQPDTSAPAKQDPAIAQANATAPATTAQQPSASVTIIKSEEGALAVNATQTQQAAQTGQPEPATTVASATEASKAAQSSKASSTQPVTATSKTTTETAIASAEKPVKPSKTPAPKAGKQTEPIHTGAAVVAVANAPENQTSTVSVVEGETIVFRNILFDFDKSALRPESVAELNKVSGYMKLKSGTEVRIDGHTDWIGKPEYNMALSERRAKAASGYLVDKGGIDDSRVTFQFFGETMPIAPNNNPDGSDNPEGRQLNRRCEFKIEQGGTAENVVLKF